MKFAYAAVASLVLVAPALAGPTKTVGQVTFTCEVTGSDKDGFKIVAKNDGKTNRKCTASCTLTLADKKTRTWKYPSSGTTAVNAGPVKIYFGGEGSQPGKPFTNPVLTAASCD